MAFSDLCHIGNAYKTVENDTDQSERIMEENSIVRDLITKILDETGPTEGGGSIQPPEKAIGSIQSVYPKNDTGNTSYIPPSYNSYQNNLYNFTQNDQNGFNNYNMPNGFGTNGFVNYPDNDVTALLGIDLVTDATDTVTPEQLNLLRLAAQEIGGAQFTNPNKFDDKFYNYFEPNQRHSLPETNMLNVNFSRPNSLNLDMNFNGNFDFANQRFPNYKDQSQDPAEILAYLSQLNISLERSRDDGMLNGMDFKMPLDLNGHYPNDYNKMDEQGKFYNRNFPNKTFDNCYDMMQMNDRSPIGQNYDFPSPPTPASSNSMNYKPNGYHQNEYMQRRDMNQLMPRDGYQPNGMSERSNFDNVGRENMQQMALMRQNHELARQMSLLMRNRPPPNQLNVDVFLHENTFGLGLGALIAPNQQVQQQVISSPVVDLTLLAPFYAMRTAKSPTTASSILHIRLDACYEQWRQLERERKRTEARLALAYPGRAVSSSNSIPVPRLPPCPTRVDRLTVDMLREHTKVLTLMGKMETLRASVCVANKKPNKPEDTKIIVLKRGQENVAANEKDVGLDPATFEPSTWREELKNNVDMGTCVAPHPEVESAMVTWRSAVCAVQAARRRELARDPRAAPRSAKHDLQLAEAVRHLCVCARRARAAMWADLTLTVALATRHAPTTTAPATSTPATTTTTPAVTAHSNAQSENVPPRSIQATPAIQPAPETTTANTTAQNNAKPTTSDAKEEKPATETKIEPKPDANKPANKQTDKDKNRRTQYRKVNQGRNDFYQKNQRYDNRFMHNRHPYHYLATGPIN